MAGEFKIKVNGVDELKTQLLTLAPELRRGSARRALRAGAKPILAKAIAETPRLKKDIYRRGVMIRRAGTLQRSLTIRNSKDVNRTGDVGVFVNIKPLTKGAVMSFKQATGRRSSTNPDDPFYWKFIEFSTRRNPNPAKFLRKAGEILASAALPIITDSLKKYFERLARRIAR